MRGRKEENVSKKIRIGVLCGGKSAEHEVSLLSAKSVIAALDKQKYEITIIGIDKDGHWYHLDNNKPFLYSDDPAKICINIQGRHLAVQPGDGRILEILDDSIAEIEIDVAFPVLHGPLGEDGAVQGLLKICEIPFVGADVLGSAVGMDKVAMKKLLEAEAVPVSAYLAFNKGDKIAYEQVIEKLGLPLFIKPANMGSSVGVNKVNDEDSFWFAIHDAFKYDKKILVEEFIDGREIECSVLGNEFPRASLPGEIAVAKEFYSYDAKYLSADGAELLIPAPLDETVTAAVRKLAVKAYKALFCEGLGRMDFFYTKDGRILVNEINTLPGFTKISMYPKMWEATGLSYPKLLDELVDLALTRARGEQQKQTHESNQVVK